MVIRYRPVVNWIDWQGRYLVMEGGREGRMDEGREEGRGGEEEGR